MSNQLSKLLSLGKGKQLKAYNKTLQQISSFEPKLQESSDDELRRAADTLRERSQSGESLDALLPEAFALVREASLRTIGLRHYDVQLIGAMALHDGCIAEMKTGEGKTLVSTAAVFLNALDGSNVHVVTVNDYLAKRDSEWMGGIYHFLGLEVGLIQNGMEPYNRKPAYQASVTYGTNSEFGFDYLRDNTVSQTSERVQRGHHFAIVDEVDSILIDEARTPLIISGLGGAPASMYTAFASIVPTLDEETDYVLDEKKHTVYATESGLDKIEGMLGQEVYADLSGVLANHLKQALRAEYLYKRDRHYVVVDGEVKIVDEFTGRIMEGRRFSEGLHQAIEAKEHVEIKAETHTLATVTLQNYFRLYTKLSGMTGTALTEDSEFKQIYNLPVIPIPTNKPVIRNDYDDYVFRTKEAKYNAVVDEVIRRHEKGQPVLVGTASIEASETLSDLLDEQKIPHETLNAKNPEREARIVAQAGRVGAVTIATNMAGRGTDILLGGNYDVLKADAFSQFETTEEDACDWQLEYAESKARFITEREGYDVRCFGGLCVIGTERHESRRIDNQLRGRSGRQGDPGESRFYLSLEDDLLRLFGAERLDKVSEMMEKQGIPDDDPLQDALVSKVIGTAQQQVESMHFASRKNVLEYDDVMDLQRKAIYQERNAILDGKDVEEHMPIFAREAVDSILSDACPYEVASDYWDFASVNAWFASLTGDETFRAQDIDHDEDPDEIADIMLECIEETLQEKRNALGAEDFNNLCKQTMLHMIDTHWIEHLTDMEQLKAGIGLRALGHRDPLVEYKNEAYEAFGALTESIYQDFLQVILRLPVSEEQAFELPNNDDPYDRENMIYSNADSSPVDKASSDIGNPLEG